MARAPSATVRRIRKTTNNDSFLEQIFTHLRSAGEGEGDGQGGHGEVFAQLQFCAACTYLNEDRLAACSICGGQEFVDEV